LFGGYSWDPVGKITEKEVRRSVFLTTWHCVLSADLTKHALFQTVFFGDFAHWGSSSLKFTS